MVGGAVRDALLGLPIQDRDWVVVGGTPEELVARGFLPVGKDFPVFLHPTTKEEYALARTERKTARGYHGFTVYAAPDVTLEQDLARRDLTINSIAACAYIDWATGRFSAESDLNPANLIDPYNGQADIQAKVLRHVTDAFREDPVRILRVARFAARFADFSVAPETMQLMQRMVTDGEVDALVAERVWQELSRGLMESKPSRMLQVLRECGALEVLLPEIKLANLEIKSESDPNLMDSNLILDTAARIKAPLAVRFACLTNSLAPEFLKAICNRLRVPTDCKDLADLLVRERVKIQHSSDLDAADLVKLLERCDAFRKPQRFSDLLLACECIDEQLELGQYLPGALQAAQSVVTSEVAEAAVAQGLDGKQIGERVHAARVVAVAAALNNL